MCSFSSTVVCSHWHLSMRNINMEDCVSSFHDLLNGFFFYLFVVAQNKRDREKNPLSFKVSSHSELIWRRMMCATYEALDQTQDFSSVLFKIQTAWQLFPGDSFRGRRFIFKLASVFTPECRFCVDSYHCEHHHYEESAECNPVVEIYANFPSFYLLHLFRPVEEVTDRC